MSQPVHLHNTPAAKKQLLTPLEPGVIRLYTCGPTVYNYLHIGNWVAYIRWDTLVRMLTLSGYSVNRVMNITDVGHLTGDNEGDADTGEDKLEKGARREGKTAWQVAEMYTEDFLRGMTALQLVPPTHMAKATDYIPQQVALVETLAAKGYTYEIDDGIYFDTSKFPRYADFARLDLSGQQAGARVALNDQKRNASDFAVWKYTPDGVERAMEWDSPLGNKRRGFPGWHLECSAIAMHLLGDTLDIHTGGIDHIPVHHTNEIAQSEAATGQPFAHYWLHTAFLLSNGTKISKSLGNGFTLQDIVAKGFAPLDFKLLALQSHYRTEGNFSWDNLASAKQRLAHWQSIARLRWQSPQEAASLQLNEDRAAILAALQDDLDTPSALQHTEKAIDTITKQHAAGTIDAASITSFFEFLDQALGLDIIGSTPDIDDEAKQLMQQRATARAQKDYAASDRLRDEFKQQSGHDVRDASIAGKPAQLWG